MRVTSLSKKLFPHSCLRFIPFSSSLFTCVHIVVVTGVVLTAIQMFLERMFFSSSRSYSPFYDDYYSDEYLSTSEESDDDDLYWCEDCGDWHRRSMDTRRRRLYVPFFWLVR